MALAATIAVGASCGWNEDRSTNPTEGSTAAYFTAKIGAESFVGQISSASRLTSSSPLTIRGTSVDLQGIPTGISIQVRNPGLGTFDLGVPFGPDAGTYGSMLIGQTSAFYWLTQKTGDGTLSITSISETMIEGTFRFDAAGATAASNPQVQRITEGKFRVRLCPIGASVC